MPDYFTDDSPNTSERNNAETREQIVDYLDSVNLSVDDSKLAHIIDERIKKSESWFEKNMALKQRRDRNEDYYFGRQLPLHKLKDYHSRYMDNIIYESQSIIKAIALSRPPELLVKPGNDSEQAKDNAEKLTQVMNNDMRQRENKRVLGIAFKHLPVYLTGIIKPYWDPTKGRGGDYAFRVVNPNDVIMDHSAASNDEAEMEFIAEYAEKTLKQLMMMFPAKADELYAMVNSTKNKKGKKSREDLLSSPLRYVESWWTWYDERTNEDTGHKEFSKEEIVVWKYKNLILGKMKNPYWDWEGEKQYFRAEPDGQRRELNEEEITQMVLGGERPEFDEVFHNFFQDPKKPYIFLGYDQWGDRPIDETSGLEQVIYLQDNVNKRGRQITELNDLAKGKHVFSTTSGLSKKDIEEMDLEDPHEDIIIDGDISRVHNFIPGTPAISAMYTEQEQDRQKAFSKMHTHSTTRGEAQTDVATTNQILRESDFGVIDDLTKDTINWAAEQMAAWAMQFIKLFYTAEHMRNVFGSDGEEVFVNISRDTVDDGMEVMVSASSVDKLEAKRDANIRLQAGLTDPLSYFEDTETPDPKGRVERLMIFSIAPELYLQKYVLGKDTEQQVEELSQMPVVGPRSQATPESDAAMAQQLPGVGGGGLQRRGGFDLGMGGGNGVGRNYSNNRL